MGLEMILSHNMAWPSFDMSPYRPIWIDFASISLILILTLVLVLNLLLKQVVDWSVVQPDYHHQSLSDATAGSGARFANKPLPNSSGTLRYPPGGVEFVKAPLRGNV